jgi:hypothetical protein
MEIAAIIEFAETQIERIGWEAGEIDLISPMIAKIRRVIRLTRCRNRPMRRHVEWATCGCSTTGAWARSAARSTNWCYRREGRGPHTSNARLGKFGRDRSNAWNYAGANRFNKSRMDDLAAHPHNHGKPLVPRDFPQTHLSAWGNRALELETTRGGVRKAVWGEARQQAWGRYHHQR